MITFGIIGAGRLGTNHATNIAQMDGAKLTAVYDIDPAKAKVFNEQYGAVICNSADELANMVDAVLVASPSDCHLEGVTAAVKANKPVFSEKPLCRTAEQSAAYKELVKDYKQVYGIGYVRRYMAKTQIAKKLLDENTLGTLKFCNVDLPFGAFKRMYGDWFADYKRSGGVILDMLAHHIDLANWFFGKPVRVYAQSMLLDPKQELPSDYVSMTVTYESGVIVNMMCSWQRFGRSNEMMEIYGDKGSLTLDGSTQLKIARLGAEEVEVIEAEEVQKGSSMNNVNTGNGFYNELAAFVDCINNKKVFTPGIPEGFMSFAVAEAAMRSAETNQVVEIKY